MEDLIPILIVVAISAIGAINRNKKKKIEQQRLEQAKNDDVAFEEPEPMLKEQEYSWFEKQLLGIEDEPQQVYSEPNEVFQMPDKVVVPVVEPEKSFAEVKEELMEKEGISSIENSETVDYNNLGESISDGEIKDAVEEEEDTRVQDIMGDFSLDKAVVYAEILGRKYV